MKRKSAVDDVAAKLCGGFVRGKVNHGGNLVVVKLSQIASVDCVADEQQVVVSLADQCRFTVAWITVG